MFFSVNLFRVEVFIRILNNGNQFSSTWNLSLLLGRIS